MTTLTIILKIIIIIIIIIIIKNGNRTEWSPIRSVIIRVINTSSVAAALSLSQSRSHAYLFCIFSTVFKEKRDCSQSIQPHVLVALIQCATIATEVIKVATESKEDVVIINYVC